MIERKGRSGVLAKRFNAKAQRGKGAKKGKGLTQRNKDTKGQSVMIERKGRSGVLVKRFNAKAQRGKGAEKGKGLTQRDEE